MLDIYEALTGKLYDYMLAARSTKGFYVPSYREPVVYELRDPRIEDRNFVFDGYLLTALIGINRHNELELHWDDDWDLFYPKQSA
jgi:hypothetical protein